MPNYPPLAARIDRLHSSAIRDLLTITARPDVISLAGGLPDPALIDRTRIAAAAVGELADPVTSQYTETSGWAGLRTVLQERESALLGRKVDVLVTHGSQQALSLLASALLDPGALVVVEDPAYTGALQVFRSVDAEIEAVPLDAGGMRVDVLAELLRAGLRPAVVHTVSNFHNPRGVTLTATRRAELAGLADRYGFWVIEDDPYGEIWFDTPAPAPVAAHSDRVVRLSSASKIIAPALRTGWLVAPEPVLHAVELLKQGADLCGSTLAHRITAELLSDTTWLAQHLESVRSAYGARAKALDAALESAFGAAVRFDTVAGGMFTWVDFTDGTPTDELLPLALAEGVAFVPGSAFAVGTGQRNSMRLCFTAAPEAVLVEAVARLARAWARGGR